ncbi:MAG: stage IV sporulation protein A [Clostridia bacterium]|nr:stage IV sporulation protein A [Clostridia bacterium]
MEERNVYQDMAQRTGGDIYIGVVGPVRTGKSTFIKKFMDTLVIPNIADAETKKRAVDELPQSSAGKTIMTTEPKFIPENAVEVKIGDSAKFSARMVDCVGYIVPSALGYIENDNPRMVMTPWFDEEVPFGMAAEIGTKKVITDHSTIGILITTDGTISDIERDEYEEAEEKAVNELKKINKPFVILLNSIDKDDSETIELANSLAKKYEVPTIPVNCSELSENEIKRILAEILFEFPVREIKIDMPAWIASLEPNHWLRSSIYGCIKDFAGNISKISELETLSGGLSDCEFVNSAEIVSVDLGTGSATIKVSLKPDLFFKVLSEKTGINIANECEMMDSMMDLARLKEKYGKIAAAYDEVEESGYGIVMPTMEELKLDEPEIIKQNGKYGIRLRASAPSVHMMKTRIQTEVTPIVGSEQQSEELVMYLLKEFEENPTKIWESNIFGKSLHELVNEGLHNKLYRMPTDARVKIKETIERIINEGCNGLVCIIL